MISYISTALLAAQVVAGAVVKRDGGAGEAGGHCAAPKPITQASVLPTKQYALSSSASKPHVVLITITDYLTVASPVQPTSASPRPSTIITTITDFVTVPASPSPSPYNPSAPVWYSGPDILPIPNPAANPVINPNPSFSLDTSDLSDVESSSYPVLSSTEGSAPLSSATLSRVESAALSYVASSPEPVPSNSKAPSSLSGFIYPASSTGEPSPNSALLTSTSVPSTSGSSEPNAPKSSQSVPADSALPSLVLAPSSNPFGFLSTKKPASTPGPLGYAVDPSSSVFRNVTAVSSTSKAPMPTNGTAPALSSKYNGADAQSTQYQASSHRSMSSVLLPTEAPTVSPSSTVASSKSSSKPSSESSSKLSSSAEGYSMATIKTSSSPSSSSTVASPIGIDPSYTAVVVVPIISYATVPLDKRAEETQPPQFDETDNIPAEDKREPGYRNGHNPALHEGKIKVHFERREAAPETISSARLPHSTLAPKASNAPKPTSALHPSPKPAPSASKPNTNAPKPISTPKPSSKPAPKPAGDVKTVVASQDPRCPYPYPGIHCGKPSTMVTTQSKKASKTASRAAQKTGWCPYPYPGGSGAEC